MRVLIIVLGLICAACALPRQSRIVGGSTTTIENYPFMAGILGRSWTGGFFQGCGGTLITRTSVVSAAHCFSNRAPSASRVRLGSTNASSGGKVHLLSKIIVHQQYNARLVINDVAVLKLTEPAVFSNKISAARIAGPDYNLPVNTYVDVIGWGDTQYKGNPSEILRQVAVHVIDQQICVERYAYLKTLPDTSNMPDVTPEMLCTGILDVGGKDACQGDSGGPIIHNKDVLVGITSWGYECAHPIYPGVSARVSSYTDWIYNNSLN